MKPTTKVMIMAVLVVFLMVTTTAALPVKIGGYKYKDNGLAKSTLVPLDGWTMTLKKLVPGSSPAQYNDVASTTTGSLGTPGYYEFTVSEAGGYRVYETIPAGWAAYSPGTGYLSVTVSATSTDSLANNFFNYQIPSVVVSGHKYLDPDAKHTSKTYPLGGWTIRLKKLVPGSSPAVYNDVAVTTTADDGTGYYVFPPITVTGSYRVVEDVSPGYAVSWPVSGYIGIPTIKGGMFDPIPNQDFWNSEAMSVVISGHKYEDRDMSHTSADYPIADWPMMLKKLVPGSSPPQYTDVASTTTDSAGYYAFPPVTEKGGYKVVEGAMTGYKPSFPPSGEISLNLIPSSSAPTVNFWNYKVPDVTIQGYKFSDPDGKYTSRDHPLEGWTIILKKVVPGSDPIQYEEIASDITDSNGAYELKITDVGSYRVAEVGQSGYTATWPADGDIGFNIKPRQTDTFTEQNFWNKPDGGGEPPVAVPEFPTIAVSVMIVSGMFIAVQFMKKRD